jgi:hypothetical protein
MIFGQVMPKIHHGGGGSCTEAFRPFSEDVWSGGVFGGDKRVKSYTNSYKFAKTKKLAQWSDPKTLFVFVLHKHKFVFVFVKELLCVPKNSCHRPTQLYA